MISGQLVSDWIFAKNKLVQVQIDLTKGVIKVYSDSGKCLKVIDKCLSRRHALAQAKSYLKNNGVKIYDEVRTRN